MRPGLDYIPAGHIQQALLGGGVRSGRGGQLRGRRVEEGRLVGKQLQGQRRARSERELCGQAAQSGIGEPLGEFQVAELAGNLRVCPMDRLGALEDGELTGVADVDEKVFGGAREAQDAFDQVVHVAEAAGLAAVAVDRQRLAAQLETGARTSPRPARRDGIPRRRT
jgi:hypothetical protein